MSFFTTEDIHAAYVKLRSYIYHDNTDIYLRRQLVEFETDITKDFIFGKISYYTRRKRSSKLTVDEKLKQLTDNLNEYHRNPNFFDSLIKDLSINYYPKKIVSNKTESNFITNKKSREEYQVEKLTPFINAPIELHIISVLWIIYHGVPLDAKLGDECLGNRLILNKDRTQLIKGSGLFKPYFNQYQRWRDNALLHAKQMLGEKRNVAFVNLDIKEFFTSVQLPKDELYSEREVDMEGHPSLYSYYNLKNIFLSLHEKYTEILFKNTKGKIDKEDNRNYVILPIGLVSSYVLANHYLKKFDDSINRHIKPIYYGRYVDDLLFVIADPIHPDDLLNDEFVDNNLTHNYTLLENFIYENFRPVLDIKPQKSTSTSKPSHLIQLEGDRYKSLHCQSDKSLVYLFDANESHLVIDKLKEELRERTSEFRDFPDEEESKVNFTDSAYHLQYEDSKDKVRTLKDYKEDRFGLTLFLANKIFSSLRQEEQLSDELCDSVLKFFKYKTAVDFYRLWEKIFTLFLVNNKPKYYVQFYLQCLEEIDKLKTSNELKPRLNDLKLALSDYLDIANEITFSLNLGFYEKAFEATRDFEFKTKEWNSNIFFSINNYQPTRADAYWRKRFRKANMMRHHYIIHPLLNYTEDSKKSKLKNLVNPHIDFSNYKLDDELLASSPRRVNFWECNMAQIFVELNNESEKISDDYTSTIFDIKGNLLDQEDDLYLEKDEIDFEDETDCLLNSSHRLFSIINKSHIPDYEFKSNGNASKNKIFEIDSITKRNSPEVCLNEIKTNSGLSKEKFRIAFANTYVKEPNILKGIRGKSNLEQDRVRKLGNIIRSARKENADILLFPEFFIPIELLSSIVDYGRKNEKLVISGLEHIIIGKFAFNFIVTTVPVTINGVKDAIVIPRLKNHYAHLEQHIIEGNHKKVPKPKTYRYDLFNWRNLYFSPYYCFELANIHHRGLWKNKLDLIIGVEWNKDTPYYSNIVEATSRDLHCYFAQVNTSHFGDSRLTGPVESALKDLLRLKGGENDTLLVAKVETGTLREFQRQTFSITHGNKEFKPLPPDFDLSLVLKRINNQSVLKD